MPETQESVYAKNSSSPLPTRWLVISYFAGIDGLACSHHVDDRLAALRRKGIEPVLITGLNSGQHNEYRVLRVPSASPVALRRELRQRIKKSCRSACLGYLLRGIVTLLLFPAYSLEKLFVRIDQTWGWTISAAIVGIIVARRRKSELIYSTGGPIGAHLAAALVARFTGLPWYAEFQDPLVHYYCARSRLEYLLTLWAEKLICRRARGVVLLTEGARTATIKRCGYEDKLHVIYPGAQDPAIKAPRLRGPQFVIAHFGSLEGARNLRVMLEAVLLYLENHPNAVETLSIRLYGHVGKYSQEVLENFPHRNIVKISEKVERREALRLMREVDALLLVQGVDEVAPQTIPSKTYEYMHAGVPILALVHENPELARMLAELGHFVAKADDPSDVADKIAQLHHNWIKGTHITCSPSPYTCDAAAEKLLCCITNLANTNLSNGRKCSLSPEDWANRLSSTLGTEPPSAWSEAIAEWVKPEFSILELGGGTGRLAKKIMASRKVLLDFSKAALEIAAATVPEAKTVLHDLRERPWPFQDGEFDVSYSVGLLEHFSDEEIIEILREQARVSKLIISLVPNAGCFFYRYWKWALEKSNEWLYAYENPKHSLCQHYAAAGIEVVSETTTDLDSLTFFQHHMQLQPTVWNQIRQFLIEVPDARQGYLIVTVGRSALHDAFGST